jgi:hypothetical protein
MSSEPGQGTHSISTFPLCEKGIRKTNFPRTHYRRPGQIRRFSWWKINREFADWSETLEERGYTVLEATDGYEALRVIETLEARSKLLPTDVIMPLMDGQVLATRLRSTRPEIRVLYMSGFTDEVLAFHGIAHPEIAFIGEALYESGIGGEG